MKENSIKQAYEIAAGRYALRAGAFVFAKKLFFLCCMAMWLTGCESKLIKDDNETTGDDVPANKDYEWLYPAQEKNTPMIKFKDMGMDEIQQTMQGKWQIVWYCIYGLQFVDDPGLCGDVTDSYFEVSGLDTIRYTGANVYMEEVWKWERKLYGCLVFIGNDTNEIGYFHARGTQYYHMFHGMMNDTLYASSGITDDVFRRFSGWKCIRMK
jgi:hypothetical protein